MDVSIIIVNYNTIRLTLDAINSIREKITGIKYEVIVVDNNSSDDSENILKNLYKDEVVYVALSENVGFGRANNEGVKIAKGRNILFLNPDTILLNNAVKELCDFLDKNRDVGACGGNLYDELLLPTISYEMNFPSIFYECNLITGKMLEKMRYGKNRIHNLSGEPISVAYISGADLMVKRTVLDKVGGFNPLFFMYYEETELCWRISKEGYKIKSIPSARIQHLEGKSFSEEKINKVRLDMMYSGRNIFYNLCYTNIYKKYANFIFQILLAVVIIKSFTFSRTKLDYWFAVNESFNKSK